MTAVALSDIGMRRRNNQDSFTVVLAESQSQWSQQGHLFVVADGMGAHAAGELASRLATELIPHHYIKLGYLVPAEALTQSIAETNNEIFRRGQANPEFRSMGTTASVLVLLPEGAVVAHVGDSRIYRLRGNTLEQLTFDHSLVWEMRATGEVSEDTLQSGIIPKNVITRSLGPNMVVDVDLEGPFPIQANDRFLLCSDGLTGLISDEELGILMRVLPPDQAARVLVDLANLRGGPDNITVIIVEVVDSRLQTTETQTKRESPKFHPKAATFPTSLGVIGAIGILAGAILAILQLWPLGAVAAAIGVFSLTLGWWKQRSGRHDFENQGSRYGKGPHRVFPLKGDAGLVDRLAGTVHALRDVAAEHGWNIQWDEIDQKQESARAAEKGGNKFEAIKFYSSIIMKIMDQARKQRESEASNSSIEL